jgi:hypothetical protein
VVSLTFAEGPFSALCSLGSVLCSTPLILGSQRSLLMMSPRNISKLGWSVTMHRVSHDRRIQRLVHLLIWARRANRLASSSQARATSKHTYRIVRMHQVSRLSISICIALFSSFEATGELFYVSIFSLYICISGKVKKSSTHHSRKQASLATSKID